MAGGESHGKPTGGGKLDKTVFNAHGNTMNSQCQQRGTSRTRWETMGERERERDGAKEMTASERKKERKKPKKENEQGFPNRQRAAAIGCKPEATPSFEVADVSFLALEPA